MQAIPPPAIFENDYSIALVQEVDEHTNEENLEAMCEYYTGASASVK